jgi:hypothetical protein
LNEFQSFLETINKRAPSPAKTGCGLTQEKVGLVIQYMTAKSLSGLIQLVGQPVGKGGG